MESFFTNGWTIGIGGGIISGFVVFLVTSKVFSKRENKEYLQKVRIANNELLYAIRPFIAEKKLPNIGIINSLLDSTSRKYGVQLKDLFSIDEIADNLTKEIMDNPFLTSENKLEYCEFTTEIKNLISTPDPEEKTEKVVYLEKDRLISKEFFSLTLGIITTLTVAMAIYFISKERSIISDVDFLKEGTFLVMIISIIIPLIALSASKLSVRIKNKEMEKEFEKEIRNELNKFRFEKKNGED